MIVFAIFTFVYNSILAYFLCIYGYTDGLILCCVLLMINAGVICTEAILKKQERELNYY
jgi:hypothetical protein